VSQDSTLLRYLPAVLLSVSLNASAQLFLRKGLANMSLRMPGGGRELVETVLTVLNLGVVLGLLCYAISIFVWMYVLSKLQVSIAYPFLSIGYVIVLLGGFFFFNETISLMKCAGVALICAGVVLISGA
jgi:multidrug transporter EmrE-like cation transporter